MTSGRSPDPIRAAMAPATGAPGRASARSPDVVDGRGAEVAERARPPPRSRPPQVTAATVEPMDRASVSSSSVVLGGRSVGDFGEDPDLVDRHRVCS